MPVEADALSHRCDPTVAVDDDNRINQPPSDSWTARHDKVLLQQSATHPLPVATCHRCLELAQHMHRARLWRPTQCRGSGYAASAAGPRPTLCTCPTCCTIIQPIAA